MSGVGRAALALPPFSGTWLVAAALLLDVIALASIWTARHHSSKAKTVWTVIVLLLPLLGAAGWFLLGRERPRRT